MFCFLGQFAHAGGGSTFGSGGSSSSSGSGGHAWVNIFSFKEIQEISTRVFIWIKVRTGKKFLPTAVRFGKRYYQRRKYSQGVYAGIGAGAGYHAGSHMHHNQYGGYYPYCT